MVETGKTRLTWGSINYGVLRGSTLAIVVKDPKVCNFNELFLLADHTNITCLNCSVENFNKDLESVSKWF